MEMYDVSQTRNADAYLIEGTDLNSHLTSPNIQQFQAMFNDGAPEFVVDQNLYYPAATNYGYYCTGFESPGEWEDHHRIFGVDGPDIQYTGAQNESFPYVYYTPSYGFAQSPYNPYNPYIPGAMIGVDGSFGGAEQYYSLPNYQNTISSPAYIPVVQPDNFPNSSVDSSFDTSASVSRPDGKGLKHKFNSASGSFTRNSSKSLSNPTSSLARISEGPRDNTGVKKDLTSGRGFLNMASSPVHQVNASGQFCGVAEMIGPVDFNKDMDFWQQDKWSGSFPVKWHIIKDVPNANFRHIILENNENKPVTNSRDTQEIMYSKGLEMLKIFKNHNLKTSLLDDFMYYENRQKIMQEEKAKLLIRSFKNPLVLPTLEPPRKLNFVIDIPPVGDEKNAKMDDEVDSLKQISSAGHIVSSSEITSTTSVDEKAEKGSVDKEDIASVLKIGSVTITPKQVETKPSGISVANKEPLDVITVGSMQIRVNGFAESSGFLKIGTIPLDPRTLQLDGGSRVKNGS